MIASVAAENPEPMVLLVDSTTSDQIDSSYDLGLPSGTPVCFVSLAGQTCYESQPAGASTTTFPYNFAIYTESPWTVVESGCTLTLPTPTSQ